LKKFAAVGVSLLAVVVTMAMMAGPADARSRHHGRHHRGGGGGTPGPVCGPGTTLVNGVCTANPPTGPVGNGNVTITPNNVTMLLNGTFNTSITVSGLPPLTTVTPGFVACGGPAFIFPVSGTVTSDALGRITLGYTNIGGGCIPGTYPLVFTENASPFQSFTGFLTLHF
jgi:hypothetical protein